MYINIPVRSQRPLPESRLEYQTVPPVVANGSDFVTSPLCVVALRSSRRAEIIINTSFSCVRSGLGEPSGDPTSRQRRWPSARPVPDYDQVGGRSAHESRDL